MGKTKEILKRLEGIENYLRELQRETLLWREIALQSQEEKRQLLDRLMARDLRDLKENTAHEQVEAATPKVEVPPEYDLDNLGTVVT